MKQNLAGSKIAGTDTTKGAGKTDKEVCNEWFWVRAEGGVAYFHKHAKFDDNHHFVHCRSEASSGS